MKFLFVLAALFGLSTATFNLFRNLKFGPPQIQRHEYHHYEPVPVPETKYVYVDRPGPKEYVKEYVNVPQIVNKNVYVPSVARVNVAYSLDNKYFEHSRVYKANCKVDFDGVSVDKYDVCFMEGYTVLGCYEKRPHSYNANWQYQSTYSASNLTVLDNDSHYERNYGITIKGLRRHQATHCQVTVFPDTHSAESVVYTSHPVYLAANPDAYLESTPCKDDTTVVKIFKTTQNNYKCMVAFSDDTQYKQAKLTITRQAGYHCDEFDNVVRTEPTVTHIGGNVYTAEFWAPWYHSHECNVRLTDGRTYSSRLL